MMYSTKMIIQAKFINSERRKIILIRFRPHLGQNVIQNFEEYDDFKQNVQFLMVAKYISARAQIAFKCPV